MVAMQIWKNADPVLPNLLTYQKKPLIWILNVGPFNGLKGPTSWPPLSLISLLFHSSCPGHTGLYCLGSMPDTLLPHDIGTGSSICLEYSPHRLQGQCGWSTVGEEGHGREGSQRRAQGSQITGGGGEVKIIQGCFCLSQRLVDVNSI